MKHSVCNKRLLQDF